MARMPIELPPIPPGFHRIGWRGALIALPENWNLRLHGGTENAGALVFADLRTPRFELRWQRPRALSRKPPAAMLEEKCARLQKSQPAAIVRKIKPDVIEITQPSGRTVLAAADDRLYELHWPGENSPGNQMTGYFLAAQSLLAGKPERFWSLYGAQGWLPAHANLQKATLLPGRTTLAFRAGPSRFTLGSVSLADRLLKSQTLAVWAAGAIPLLSRHAAGMWQEGPEHATFIAPTRRRFQQFTHRLTLQHDQTHNRICWQHYFGPASG